MEVLPVGRQAFVAIMRDGVRQPWIFAGIYASTNANERKELWRMLTSLVDSGFPVCFVGDFNVLTEASEKCGGQFNDSLEVMEFRSFLMDNGLLDLGFIGPSCTGSTCR